MPRDCATSGISYMQVNGSSAPGLFYHRVQEPPLCGMEGLSPAAVPDEHP